MRRDPCTLVLALGAALLLAACSDAPTVPTAPKQSPRAEQPRATVLPDSKAATTAPGGPYNLRTGPGTGYSIAGTIGGNVGVTIDCTSSGESVSGYYGTSKVWDRLASGYWITDTNVYTGTDGPAVRPCIRNDYPYASASTSGVDPWNFYYRQCTSFAAFRINWNGTRSGKTFTNMYLGYHFGDAHTWDDAARSAGVPIYGSPAVGRIAQWNGGVGGASSLGHVAYVAAVYSDGSFLAEEYNWATAYGYGTRRIYPGGGYWPSNFIDF